MERFLATHRLRIPARDAHEALFISYVRNARSAIVSGRTAVAREILNKIVAVWHTHRVAPGQCSLPAVRARDTDPRGAMRGGDQGSEMLTLLLSPATLLFAGLLLLAWWLRRQGNRGPGNLAFMLCIAYYLAAAPASPTLFGRLWSMPADSMCAELPPGATILIPHWRSYRLCHEFGRDLAPGPGDFPLHQRRSRDRRAHTPGRRSTDLRRRRGRTEQRGAN